jgi:hypothetical protein
VAAKTTGEKSELEGPVVVAEKKKKKIGRKKKNNHRNLH